MSFCSDIKNEIISKNIKNNIFMSFLSGLIKSSGELTIRNKELIIIIKTEFKDLLKPINKFLKQTYNLSATIDDKTESIFAVTKYSIILPMTLTSELLYKTKFYNSQDELILGIDEEFFKSREMKLAFIKGVFVGCATSNIVLSDRSKVGSHLEFVFSNEKLASDFLEMLAEEEILANKVKRKNSFVVYLKSSNDDIFNLIAMLDASTSALEFKNKEAFNQLNNKVNRQTNCDKGNIKRMIEASVTQRQAIQIIDETIGINSLPENLQYICKLRLNNPMASLVELVNLSENTISKSGLNHRLNKIVEIAKNLKT